MAHHLVYRDPLEDPVSIAGHYTLTPSVTGADALVDALRSQQVLLSVDRLRVEARGRRRVEAAADTLRVETTFERSRVRGVRNGRPFRFAFDRDAAPGEPGDDPLDEVCRTLATGGRHFQIDARGEYRLSAEGQDVLQEAMGVIIDAPVALPDVAVEVGAQWAGEWLGDCRHEENGGRMRYRQVIRLQEIDGDGAAHLEAETSGALESSSDAGPDMKLSARSTLVLDVATGAVLATSSAGAVTVSVAAAGLEIVWGLDARFEIDGDDLPVAVAERLRACKREMIALCAREIDASGLSPIEFFAASYERTRGDGFAILDLYLDLDHGVHAELTADHRRRLRELLDTARRDIESALDDAQRAGLDRHGIGPLLARVDQPATADFFCRMNGLPDAGHNEGDYSDLFCPNPFTYAEVAEQGRTFLCCPLRMPTFVGDARDGEFLDVWNSEQAQEIRRSILDGSFTHCIEKTCSELQSRSLPRRGDVHDPYLRDIIDNDRTELDRGPATLLMNYDRSCNLACPTCRTDVIVATGEVREQAADVQTWATGTHLADVRQLHITGSGDAFGSNLFFGFLREFDPSATPDLRISLGTNGLLLTEQTWSKICTDAIDTVVVSVDAASESTYQLNRGGDFAQLVANLEFVGQLRTAGQLKAFSLNFVVQQNNYAEMPAFVALGQRVHADSVCFQQVTNWGTFSREEFERRAVHHPSHPEHGRLLEVLADPALTLPLVEMYNLAALRDGHLQRAERGGQGARE